MEPILLYGFPSGSSTGLIAALEWMGRPYRLCRVNMLGEMRDPSYKRINPRVETPALITDQGDVLTETMAIAAWLEVRDTGRRISFEPLSREADRMHQLQENWRKLEQCQKVIAKETTRDSCVDRVRPFLTDASKAFGLAEAGVSKARLAAVEPVFKEYFKKMSFHGVEPAVSKKADGEELRIGLARFYGLTKVSPQALLSESFRNAFAISLYLAAASLYGGLPRFVILDDVTSSFDAGHQHFLVELIRTTFARPGKPGGPAGDPAKPRHNAGEAFNKHSNSGA